MSDCQETITINGKIVKCDSPHYSGDRISSCTSEFTHYGSLETEETYTNCDGNTGPVSIRVGWTKCARTVFNDSRLTIL